MWVVGGGDGWRWYQVPKPMGKVSRLSFSQSIEIIYVFLYRFILLLSPSLYACVSICLSVSISVSLFVS